jgi:hypothetical protein
MNNVKHIAYDTHRQSNIINFLTLCDLNVSMCIECVGVPV